MLVPDVRERLLSSQSQQPSCDSSTLPKGTWWQMIVHVQQLDNWSVGDCAAAKRSPQEQWQACWRASHRQCWP